MRSSWHAHLGTDSLRFSTHLFLAMKGFQKCSRKVKQMLEKCSINVQKVLKKHRKTRGNTLEYVHCHLGGISFANFVFFIASFWIVIARFQVLVARFPDFSCKILGFSCKISRLQLQYSGF